MAVYGYTRVSTVEQAEDGHSLETQRRMIEGQATILGKQVDRFFVDRAVSGGRPLEKRPEGRRLLDVVAPGDDVVATKLDRVFRSASDAVTMLERLKARSVSLYLLDLGGNVTGNGVSQMVFTIMSAVAQFERERIAERIAEVKETQRQQGRFLGGSVPFGYRLTPDGGALVADPDQQATIAEMVDLRRQGRSLRAIVTEIRRRGYQLSHVGVGAVLRRTGISGVTAGPIA